MSTATLIQATPNRSATIYMAAVLIEKQGPMHRAQLYAAMDFGPEKTREGKLREAFEQDWLCETPAGQIDLTDFSLRHFENQKPKELYVGQVAAPAYRPNIFASQGLSKRFIPDRRGPRADVPDWSVRDTVTIKTIGRREA
jgi:hypothetical protein